MNICIRFHLANSAALSKFVLTDTGKGETTRYPLPPNTTGP